ncbi:MAG: transporter substrate-binding domain-containing protein [Alteromonadaceae bacterium]|nr:transporter substrate-binding domain-containing protein [Alteromonadaceae bacterium]
MSLSVELIAQDYRVLMEPSPPLQFMQDGAVSGEIYEIVSEAFEQANLSANYEMYPWARAYIMALTAHGDTFISNIARTPEREDSFQWVAVVHVYDFALISLQRLDFVKSLSDMGKLSIAVQRKDVSYEYLKSKGLGDNLFITADITESWELLSKGKVDFIVEDINILDEMSQKYLKQGQSIEFQLQLPEIKAEAWLAADLGVDIEIVNALKKSL